MNEEDLIEKIKNLYGKTKSSILGIGDDCAVWVPKPDYEYLITTDSAIEDIHFKLLEHPLAAIGYKALARSISDIAAMGGMACYVLVAFVKPPKITDLDVLEIYKGMNILLNQYHLELIGGDFSQGSALIINTTVIGCCPKGKSIKRSGMQLGDQIYVTGSLGGSIYGKHLNFKPRILEAQCLVENFNINAMIDISDGLSKDLWRMVRSSHKSVEIYADKIPVDAACQGVEDPLWHALNDGEDYELIFTSPQSEEDINLIMETKFHIRCSNIGKVIGNNIELWIQYPNGKKEFLKDEGFRHF